MNILRVCCLLLLVSLVLAGCSKKENTPLRVLSGHKGDITNIVYAPDGARLATSSVDQTILIWDLATGQKTQTLQGHTAVVACMAFSPDGKLLVSGSWDQTLKLWEVASGKMLRSWQAHTPAVLAVAFSPDGKFLVSGGSDHTVKIWDASSWQLRHTLEEAENPLAYSPDGKELVTGTEARSLKIWDTTRWQVDHSLLGHKDALLSVAYSQDGKSLGSGSADTDAILWDASLWQETHRLRLQLGWVRSVTFLPNNIRFLAGAGQVVQFYDVSSGTYLTTVEGGVGIVTSIAVAPGGKTFAVGGSDQKIALYNVPDM